MTPDEAVSLIEARYRSRGDALGWRLLCSPWDTTHRADVAFIGLNPGGSEVDPAHAVLCPDAGSVYETESWHGFPPGQSPLQRQVLALFGLLDVAPDAVLAGNLIPFRSRRGKDLKNFAEARDFGKGIWEVFFSRAKPAVVITMGRDAYSAVFDLMSAREEAILPAGWGNQVVRTARSARGRIVGLPHLSRFSIVTREKSMPYLIKALSGE